MPRQRESLAETDARGLRYDVAFAAWRERPGGSVPRWAHRELWATSLGPAREPAPGDQDEARRFLLALSDGDASRLGVSRQHEAAKAQARSLARWGKGMTAEAAPASAAPAAPAPADGRTANERYRDAWQRLNDWQASARQRQSDLVEEYSRLRAAIKGGGERAEKKRADVTAAFKPLVDVLAEERQQMEMLRKLLDEGSDELVPAPEGWQVVDRSHDGSYSTQTQPSFYARHWLSPFEEALKAQGFRVEVKRYAEGGGGWELWSDCPAWQYKAMTARQTLRQSLDVWRRHSANARVYLPTLPWTGDCAAH